MKIKYFLVGILIMLFIISAQNVFAGGRKIGTAGAVELLIPMGARSVGMAGANIVNVEKTEAIYWNPAGLGRLEGSEVAFSYMTYFADMKISYLSAGFNAGKLGVFGFSLQSMDIGKFPVTTIESPEGTGEELEPDFIIVNVSYAKLLTDRISFGVNTKLISEKIGNMSASAVAWDLGLQYHSDANIDFGVVMRNIGSGMKFSGTAIEFNSDIPWANPNATSRKTALDMVSNELPASLCIGLGYRYNFDELQKINITSQYANNGYTLDNIITGMEYSYKDFIFLRAGYDLPLFPDDDEYTQDMKDDYQYGLHFGAGVDLSVGGSLIKINYAYRDMKNFDANNYFTVGFEF